MHDCELVCILFKDLSKLNLEKLFIFATDIKNLK